jgi:hypothetical protein
MNASLTASGRPTHRQGSIKITVSNWNRAIELRSGFLHVELDTGIMFANLALSTDDSLKRIRYTKNAKVAHATVLRFIRLPFSSEMESIVALFESLNYKLILLGEMGDEVLGRRLDDRIRKLAAVAHGFRFDPPMRQKITDQIKAEISEYFERERNPSYVFDRRSSIR